jgi:transposase
MEELIEVILALQAEIRELKARVNMLETENKRLKAENQLLVTEIQRLKTRKNSGNSSIPPSTDLEMPKVKPNQSLRPSSQKKSGGQPGHSGETLKMVSNPDKTEALLPTICSGCSYDLGQEPSRMVSRRQVVDIPPIKPIYTEYEQFERTCPCCKLRQSAPFPAHVQAPIQYGPNVAAMVAYLHTRQYLPLKRGKELLGSLFGLPISEGSMVNLLDKMVAKALPIYQFIEQKILESGFAGADETGCKVNGEKHWFWTIQNEAYTFIWPSQSRGFDALQEQFGDRLSELILVHDCWAAYFKTGAKAHQLCIAHLQRDLQYLLELYPQHNWAKKIQELFSQALELKRKMLEDPPEGWKKSRDVLEQELKEYIQMPLQAAGKEILKLQKRLIKHFESLTTFLHHFHVPPDNNGSERAIRNVKVKTKISGQFKTCKGADIFAVIRSVIDTLIKNQKNVFQSLANIAAW